MIIKAIVLSVRDQGEDSKLMTAYSRELGKIEILVRGAKKIVSKLAQFSAGLFATLKLTVEPGKSRYHLIGGEIKKYYKSIINNYEKNIAVGRLFKAMDEIVKSDKPNKQIFDLLVKTLEKINETPETRTELLLQAFLIKFLAFLGHRPEIKHCLICRRSLSEEVYFNAERGGTVCARCQSKEKNQIYPVKSREAGPRQGGVFAGVKLSAPVLKFLQNLLYKDLDFLAKSIFDLNDLSAVKTVINKFLEWQLR